VSGASLMKTCKKDVEKGPVHVTVHPHNSSVFQLFPRLGIGMEVSVFARENRGI